MPSPNYTPVGWVEDVTPLLPGLNTMDAGIEDAHERIDALDAFDAAAFDTRLDAVEADVATHETRLDAAEPSIADHETRLDAAEPTIANHETRLDAAEPTISDHESRIDTLEAAAGVGSPELDYAQITSPVSITATTEAGANTVVTGASVSYDGSTVVMLEFFAPQATQHTTAQEFWLVLFEDGSPVGILAHHQFPYSMIPVHGMRRFTPSAGSHTYSVRAYKAGSGGGVSVDAGAGGSGTLVPAFMRIARA